MGCISSKLLATADIDRVATHHVVSLTSSTYGLLELDRGEPEREVEATGTAPPLPLRVATPESKHKKKTTKESLPEIINTWELMKDLAESPAVKPAAKPQQTPQRRRGKENAFSSVSANSTPKEVPNHHRTLRPFSSAANRRPPPLKVDLGVSGSKRSLSPLFDPELIASFERELRDPLEVFEARCPPGGENAVVIYTTTLRGIRKTFEECNAVRSAVESHGVRVAERDVSMDSGFLEEMRAMMGRNKDAKPPLVFVKGRLIGGAGAVLRLEEEGKLGALLEGLPKREESACTACGGARFVMCRECNGSRKVADMVKCEQCNGSRKVADMVKCEQCNENGLVRCPKCAC